MKKQQEMLALRRSTVAGKHRRDRKRPYNGSVGALLFSLLMAMILVLYPLSGSAFALSADLGIGDGSGTEQSITDKPIEPTAPAGADEESLEATDESSDESSDEASDEGIEEATNGAANGTTEGSPAGSSTLLPQAGDSIIINGGDAGAEAALKDAIQKNDSITIIIEGNLNLSGTLTIAAGKNVTLSGSGKLIANGNYDAITVNGTLTIDGITVTRAAGTNASGVRVNSGGSLFMASGEISGHIKPDANNNGGGVYNAGSFTLSGGSIKGNQAYYGGGIYNAPGSIFTMSGGEVSGNRSSIRGGGIMLDSATFNMRGGKVTKNTSGWDGGGIYMVGRTAIFNLSGGEISYNNTGMFRSGAGIANEGGTLKMSGGLIAYNTTSESGGGVWNRETYVGITKYPAVFEMTGGEIRNNTAGQYGGGVRNEQSTFIMTDGKISNNTAISGGGVDNSNSAYFKLVDGEISNNKSTGSGNGGGGVANSSNGTFDMISGTIAGNTAAVSGGGVSNYNAATFNISGGTISGNTSDNYGGGVTNAHATVNMSGGTISDNLAKDWDGGGGVANSGGDYPFAPSIFNMSGGQIINNSAWTYGGGVSNYDGATFNMSGGAISNNTTPVYSGGVDNTWATFNMSGGSISGNSTGWYGGGVGNYSASFFMTGGEICNNISGWDGGGFMNWYGTLVMTGGKNYDNTAANMGGGVFVPYNDLASVIVGADAEFYGNIADYLTYRFPADDAVYAASVQTDLWTSPLKQGYNNYDISYPKEYQAFVLIYNGNGNTGGTAPEGDVYNAATKVTVADSNTLVKTNHHFLGWALSSDATAPDYLAGATFVITANTTLYAVWAQDPTYTVVYAPGTQGTFAKQVTDGLFAGEATPAAPVVTGNPGWKFIGWQPVVSDTVTGDATYVAQWEQLYTVIYEPGTQGTFAKQVTDGLSAGDATPAAPAVTGNAGWKFIGWQPVVSDTVTGDATYVAQWARIIYTVIFVDWDDTELKTEYVARGNDATAPADPTREGYTFIGWDRGYTNITENIIVRALYEPIPSEPETEENVPPVPPFVPVPPVPPTPENPIGPEGPGPDVEDVPTLVIGGIEIPLYGLNGEAWALVNLILTVTGLLLAAITVIRTAIRKKRSEQEQEQEQAADAEEQKKRKPVFSIAALAILAVIGIIFFLFTEDMRLPMVLIDIWTIGSAVILLAEIVFMIAASKKEKASEA